MAGASGAAAVFVSTVSDDASPTAEAVDKCDVEEAEDMTGSLLATLVPRSLVTLLTTLSLAASIFFSSVSLLPEAPFDEVPVLAAKFSTWPGAGLGVASAPARTCGEIVGERPLTGAERSTGPAVGGSVAPMGFAGARGEASAPAVVAVSVPSLAWLSGEGPAERGAFFVSARMGDREPSAAANVNGGRTAVGEDVAAVGSATAETVAATGALASRRSACTSRSDKLRFASTIIRG